jgi:hypothetical protein
MTTTYTPLYQILAGGPGSGCHGGNCGRPKGVAKEFTTSSGAKYTIYKPSKKGIARRASSYTRPSKFKGQFTDRQFLHDEHGRGEFRKTDDISGIEGRKNRVLASYEYQYPKGDKYYGHGATLFVHRDFAKSRVVIQEIPHDELNWTGIAKQYTFRNFGTAAGFLNKQFGIRQKLPKRTSQDLSQHFKD